VQRLWRIDGAFLHLEQRANLLLRRGLIARDRNFADVILRPFRYRNGDNHWPVLALLPNLFHFHVDGNRDFDRILSRYRGLAVTASRPAGPTYREMQ